MQKEYIRSLTPTEIEKLNELSRKPENGFKKELRIYPETKNATRARRRRNAVAYLKTVPHSVESFISQNLMMPEPVNKTDRDIKYIMDIDKKQRHVKIGDFPIDPKAQLEMHKLLSGYEGHIKLHGTGGSKFTDFLKGFWSVAKEVAPIAAPLLLGAGIPIAPPHSQKAHYKKTF